jgi:hypothetical protein
MGRPRFRLGRRWRQVLLLIHIVSGVGWLGIDLAVAPLAITGLAASDGGLAAACYLAIAVLVPATVPSLALTMTATGILLGWGTQWGLLRYWWVAVKLVLALVLTALVWVLLLPAVGSVSGLAPSASGDEVRASLGAFPVQIMFPIGVSFTSLAFASLLGVMKPWGRIRPGTPPVRSNPD